jgi:RNA-directed DNA polymerase
MHPTSYRHWIARGLARALLAHFRSNNDYSLEALQRQAATALGDNPVWLKRLVRPLARLSQPTWQQFCIESLAKRLLQDSHFDDAFANGAQPRIRQLFLPDPAMRLPPLALADCALPAITDHVALAAFLQIRPAQLNWLAPELPLESRAGSGHYLYRLVPKATGGLRLLEIPKVQLKAVQRRILDGLLAHVPPHEAAHGFRPNHSVISHAQLHAGQDVVIRFDLKDFFTSITAARIQAIFRTLGYPDGVARSLAVLCTHRSPRMIVDRLQADGGWHASAAQRLRLPHLPQGAPSSPALANLAAFSLDMRLAGLAHRLKARYSRYADDLVFSGSGQLRQQFRSLHAWVSAIAQSEGFFLHPDKTRCLPAHQQQRITGIVVNAHPNVPRADFDRLKACLHQCTLHGAASQNTDQHADFKAYLQGRIAWVHQLNPTKARRLQNLFDRIKW